MAYLFDMLVTCQQDAIPNPAIFFGPDCQTVTLSVDLTGNSVWTDTTGRTVNGTLSGSGEATWNRIPWTPEAVPGENEFTMYQFCCGDVTVFNFGRARLTELFEISCTCTPPIDTPTACADFPQAGTFDGLVKLFVNPLDENNFNIQMELKEDIADSYGCAFAKPGLDMDFGGVSDPIPYDDFPGGHDLECEVNVHLTDVFGPYPGDYTSDTTATAHLTFSP